VEEHTEKDVYDFILCLNGWLVSRLSSVELINLSSRLLAPIIISDILCKSK
jgi:hypothetical protein